MNMTPGAACSPFRKTALSGEYKSRWQDPDTIRQVLHDYKRIAIVGLSPNPERPSNMVGRYLIDKDYEIIPVNPGHEEILGLRCYKSLPDIPGPVDVVDIFRNPDTVIPVVEEAIKMGAKAIWFQIDVVNLEAGELAEENGLRVIMDRCIKIEHECLKME
ncbi:MAG: CoA-binding protein [Candidatus Margulisiibacteriota bacterium]